MRDKTTHIVIHTAAWPGDPSVEDIRQSHLQRGFDDIGYHYVIRKNGDLEAGRPEHKVGAHCRDAGMNHKSVGICLSGHHDNEEPTTEQLRTIASLVNVLCRAYSITIENVIGHRETGANKTCPGTKIDMDQLRRFIEFQNVTGVPEAHSPEYLKPDKKFTSDHDKDGDGIKDDKDKDKDGIKDEDEEPVTGSPEFEEENYIGPGAGKKKFRETTFGKIVFGKNKIGKAVFGVLGSAATVYAGTWFEPVNRILQQITTGGTPLIPNIGGTMELEILDLILIAVAAIITFVTTRGLISGTLNEIADEVKQVISAIQKGREASSPGGTELTKEEQALIWKEADDIVNILWRKIIRSRILRWLGLDKGHFDEAKGDPN